MVEACLSRLKGALKRHLVGGSAMVISARVPIIKCVLRMEGGERMRADISMGVLNGATAVDFVARQVAAMGPVRPLVLVLKALLKVCGFVLEYEVKDSPL